MTATPIPITWEDIKERLTQKIISLMRDTDLGAKWLDGLDRCEDGERLGLCITIDMESNAINPQLFADILDLALELEIADDARSAFGKALQRHPISEQFDDSIGLTGNEPDADDSYLRILDLETFIDRYASTSAPRSPGRAGKLEVRDSYFGPTAVANFMDLDNVFSGANGRVWVISWKKYQEIRSDVGEDDLATYLNDALGLAKPAVDSNNDPTELVAIQYPNGFKNKFGVICRQPTTLDSEWVKSGWYYLSYHMGDSSDYPGWGRTQSCSGMRESMPERVHTWIAQLSDEFSGFIVGQVNHLTEERRKLIEAGYFRLSVVWTPS